MTGNQIAGKTQLWRIQGIAQIIKDGSGGWQNSRAVELKIDRQIDTAIIVDNDWSPDMAMAFAVGDDLADLLAVAL